jgi:pyruvate carboxylase subunit B
VNEAIRKKIIGNEKVITVRPADLLEPAYEKMKKEAVAQGLIKKEEDILTYILYPAVAPAFLRGEKKAEDLPKKAAAAGSSPPAGIPSAMEVEVDGEVYAVRIVSVGGSAVAQAAEPGKKAPRGDLEGGIKASMQGMVLKILVSVGSAVKQGETLLVLEAMKMENPVTSPRDGKVTDIFVDTGDIVSGGDVLLVVR